MENSKRSYAVTAILPLLFLMAVLFISASSAQTVTTVAGGFVGDGRASTQASLQDPEFVVVDRGGNGYVTDFTAHRIRKVTPLGTISTCAGTGISGYSGDGGPASSAMVSYPTGMTLDPTGNIVFADGGNSRVRKINIATGLISTIAGNGVFGYSGDGGSATLAELEQPWGVVYDPAGNLYISDVAANVVRMVDTVGIITTFAGTGTAGFSGDGGPANQSELAGPRGLTVDTSRNIYISDADNHRVRQVNSVGNINTVAGNGQPGFSGDGGPATQAAIGNPRGLAFRSGTLYIANAGKSRVRTVINSTINTFAGSSLGYDGDDHPPLSTMFAGPFSVLPLSATTVVFGDRLNGRVRELAGGVVKTVAGGYLGDGNGGTNASLVLPENIAFDTHGNAYIADAEGNRIRKLDTTGKISTVAGNGTSGYTGDGGLATSAQLYFPYGVAVDSTGDIFIADNFNSVIRRVDTMGHIATYATNGNFFSLQTLTLDKSGNLYAVDSASCVVWKIDTSANVTIVAGVLSLCGYNGDNIPATTAQLNTPYGIGFDIRGNLYIADSSNNRIRSVSTSGVITTVAGNGTCGYSGDNGPPTSAEICFPEGVVISGNTMYIADTFNVRIRRVADNLITTYAGTGITGYNGNGLSALSTNLDDPVAVAVDPTGILYVVDDSQNRVRRVH